MSYRLCVIHALFGYGDPFVWTHRAYGTTVLPSNICCVAAVLIQQKLNVKECLEHKLGTSVQSDRTQKLHAVSHGTQALYDIVAAVI